MNTQGVEKTTFVKLNLIHLLQDDNKRKSAENSRKYVLIQLLQATRDSSHSFDRQMSLAKHWFQNNINIHFILFTNPMKILTAISLNAKVGILLDVMTDTNVDRHRKLEILYDCRNVMKMSLKYNNLDNLDN